MTWRSWRRQRPCRLEMLKITIKHNLDDLAHLRWMRKRKEAEEEAKDYVECSVFAPARAGTRSLDPWSRHFYIKHDSLRQL